MKSTAAFIWLIFLGSGAFSQTAKLNIAVNDLSAKGIKQSEAEIISERLRSELLNTGVFKVMERNDMASVLREQGFQQTGVCEASCLVEVGQLLGVERMVAGSVGKIAGMHTISLRMINVATGEIMFTVNEDFNGDLTGILTTAAGNAARKLARGAGGELAKNALAGKTGDLHITSIPAGASVEIDGNKVAGETPLTLKGTAAGERRIVVRKAEYYGSRTVTLVPDDLLKVEFAMEKGNGSMKVFTDPVGAEVHLDGKRMGMSPCKIDATTGEHDVQVVKDGYLPRRSTVAVGIGGIENLSFKLVPAGSITVACDVPSARILINGVEAGQGTIERYQVAVGEIGIAVEASGFEPFKKSIALAQGAHEQVEPKLVSVFGTLKVVTTPEGAQVYLNEQGVGTTPWTNARLQPGNYMFKVAFDTYEPVKENVIMIKDSIVTREYELKHTVTFLDSVRAVKSRISKRRRWVRRIVFGSIAAGALGGGLYMNMRTAEAADSYQASRSSKTAGKNWDNYTSYTIKRNLLYGVAGVFAAGLGISIPF